MAASQNQPVQQQGLNLWRLLLLLAIFASACTDPRPAADAGQERVDAGIELDGSEAPGDACITADAGLVRDAGLLPDAGWPCSVQSVQRGPLMPQPGALFIAHLGLGGFALGEATLAQLPDGTRILIDVGNDSHASDVVQAVQLFFGDRRVDYVVLTHHHADHEDALPDIIAQLQVQEVLHRGLTDLTEAANDNVMAELCAARADVTMVPLCTNADVRCEPEAWARPATACSLPWQADGPHLQILAANAQTASSSYERTVGPLHAVDSNGENARSLVGLLRHGPFAYVFAGDLTGGGSDTDPVEAFYVQHLQDTLPAADVLHLSHHGRDTSSSQEWMDHVMPADGRPRVAVAGISTAHLGSPHDSVVQTVLPRLGGASLYVTKVALGGAAQGLVDAQGGTVRVLTEQDGLQYAVQAVDEDGRAVQTQLVRSSGACAL